MHLISLIGWVTLPSVTTSENHYSGQKSIKPLTDTLVCVSQCLDTVSVVSLGRGVRDDVRMPEQHSGEAEASRGTDREAVLLTALLCPATEGAGHLTVQC